MGVVEELEKRVMVGLVSDTHGWLDPALQEVFAGAALIVHAGDVGSPGVLEELRAVAPVAAVRGNIDGGELSALPETILEDVAGKRFGSLHIAGSPRRPGKKARGFLRAQRPDVMVVGHSHIFAVAKVEGSLWLNPGAAGHSGFHQERTAMRLWFSEGGEIHLERIALGPRGRRASEKRNRAVIDTGGRYE